MPESNSYPRVLIVNGEPFNEQTAMGINLVSLFGRWPAERLAQLFTARIDPRNGSCAHSWRLETLSRYGREVPRKPVDRKAGEKRLNRLTKIEARLRSVARVSLDLAPYVVPAGFHEAMRWFRPQVIYSCLGSIQLCRLAAGLAKAYAIPVAPHFTDDWISTQYRDKPWLAVHRLGLLRAVGSVMQHASVGITVTDAMAQEYAAKFGIPFHAFMNPLEVPAECPGFESPGSGDELRFVYVGGLHLRRWQSLREIGEGLVELRQNGIRATLHIYAPAADLQEYGSRLASPAVRLAGSLRQEQVFDVMSGGDVLVHVESFDADMRAATRLSMSTKISQYMAAGRPLLCYGPGEVTSCRYVASTESGIAVGIQDRTMLFHALSQLCGDRDLRMNLGRHGWATAKRRHDATAVRNEFRAVLAEAARGAGQLGSKGVHPRIGAQEWSVQLCGSRRPRA